MKLLPSYILAIGGGGYIGSHVASLVAQTERKVIILDWKEDRQKCSDWAQYIVGDYGDVGVLEEIFCRYHIDAVMLFAGFIEVGESVKDPLKFYENNVAKTVALLKAMLKHGVRKLIFSSSCAVYGVPEFLPLTEEHNKNPISPYGKTKLMIEMILEDVAARFDFSYVALRYFNAAGCSPEKGLGERHDPETHLIPLLLRAAIHGTPFKIFGDDYPTPDGSCIRDYLHVIDIANAHLQALEYLEHGGQSESINLGCGVGVSVKQMVAMVEKIVGNKVNMVLENRRPGDPAILLADAGKAAKVLQWQAQHSEIEAIVRSAYQFELEKLGTCMLVTSQRVFPAQRS